MNGLAISRSMKRFIDRESRARATPPFTAPDICAVSHVRKPCLRMAWPEQRQRWDWDFWCDVPLAGLMRHGTANERLFPLQCRVGLT